MPILINNNLASSSAAATSALNVQQAQLSVKQHNIENLNNKDYTALESIIREVVHNNTMSGIEIAAITRRFDKMKAAMMYDTASDVSNLDMLLQYHQKIQDSLIKPDDKNNILLSLDSLVASINNLPQSSTTYSRKLLYEKLTDFSKSINGVYHTLAEQQKTIDLDLERMVTEANFLIKDLHNLGVSLLAQHKDTAQYAMTQNTIHSKLTSLSKYFKIDHFYDKNGVLNVHALDGGYSLVGASVYQLDYKPGSELGTQNSNGSLELLAYRYRDRVADRNQITIKIDDNLKSNFDGGAIPGLIYMRDGKIPAILDVIDQFSFDIAKSLNAIHNLGATTEEAQLHGTQNTTPNSTFAASGSLIVAPLTTEGDPIFADNFGYIISNKINLNEISINNSQNNNTITPVVNTQSIVDEINRLANKPSRVSAFGFFDIQLASMSKNFTAGSEAVLDFDLTSDGNFPDARIAISQINAQDQTGNDLSANLVNGDKLFAVASGDRIRTGNNNGPKIVLSDLPSNLSYPLKIKVQSTIEQDSIVIPVTFEFSISSPSAYDDANINGLLHKRFYATSAVTTDEIHQPKVQIIKNSQQNILEAKLVDQQGKQLPPGSPDQGRMVITMHDQTKCIAIGAGTADLQNLDGDISKVSGSFSNVFGLNDLFVTQDLNNWPTPSQSPHHNATKNFMLRPKIQENPKIFALGKITPYKNANSTTVPASNLYYNLGYNNFELVADYQTLNSSSTNDSPHDKIVNIMSNLNLDTKTLMTKQETARNIFQGAKEAFESVSSVNLNQEMVDVSLIQVAYNANARALKALQGLTDTLLSVVAS